MADVKKLKCIDKVFRPFLEFISFLKRCPTLGFSPVSWVRLQTYNDTQTRNNNLWITQRVAPCGNRTRYPLRVSQLPNHRTNRAVNVSIIVTFVRHTKLIIMLSAYSRICLTRNSTSFKTC
ncbi:hypothetical protein SFRURICE_017131 [Spodoptera frugiperda]|nr:hypothetical protein SFRURICE_017131 [Spodoptera frugiperda]